jgi:hypothetical protein
MIGSVRGSVRVVAALWLYKKSNGLSLDFFDALHTFESCKAADIRDRIYSFLGSLKDVFSKFR